MEVVVNDEQLKAHYRDYVAKPPKISEQQLAAAIREQREMVDLLSIPNTARSTSR